jgi:hypothetical protein
MRTVLALAVFAVALARCASEGFSGRGAIPATKVACLDRNASDYERAGGIGDGPKYTGRVAVIGSDPLRLGRR